MDTPFCPRPGLVALPSAQPVPDGTVLPVLAFLLRGPEPMLIDAGLGCEQEAFLDALDTVCDLATLRFIVLTHEDADHAGALSAVLERAPQCRVITTELGLARRLAAESLELDRVHRVELGTHVTIGGRRLAIVRPPLYDSPATLMVLERDEGWLFSSDAFGAFVPALVERAEELPAAVVHDGMSRFCRLHSPWLCDVDPRGFAARVDAVAALSPSWVFPSHLPPLGGAAFEALAQRARTLPLEGPARPSADPIDAA